MDPSRIYENMDFSIRQVSKATGIKESTLRYWEKTFGEYLAPDRTEGNQRAYSTDDVEKVMEIKHLLKDEMFTIMGARKRLGLE